MYIQSRIYNLITIKLGLPRNSGTRRHPLSATARPDSRWLSDTWHAVPWSTVRGSDRPSRTRRCLLRPETKIGGEEWAGVCYEFIESPQADVPVADVRSDDGTGRVCLVAAQTCHDQFVLNKSEQFGSKGATNLQMHSHYLCDVLLDAFRSAHWNEEFRNFEEGPQKALL